MGRKHFRPGARAGAARAESGDIGKLDSPISTASPAFGATPAAICAVARRFGFHPTTAAAVAELAYGHEGAA